MRFIPFFQSVTDTCRDTGWHIYDRETNSVGVIWTSETSINSYAERMNDDPSYAEGWSWTPMDRLERDYPTIHAAVQKHLRPQASQEFWEEVLLVADAAGYCEVFDRIAHVMGGPVRSQNAQVERGYVTLSVTVHVEQGTDLNVLTHAVSTALAPIDGLRFQTRVTATREENPDVKALRTRVEELRAQRAAETAPVTDGDVEEWEQALIETAE